MGFCAVAARWSRASEAQGECCPRYEKRSRSSEQEPVSAASQPDETERTRREGWVYFFPLSLHSLTLDELLVTVKHWLSILGRANDKSAPPATPACLA